MIIDVILGCLIAQFLGVVFKITLAAAAKTIAQLNAEAEARKRDRRAAIQSFVKRP